MVVPSQWRDVEECLGISGEQRQHGFQEDHQLAEQVDALGANGLDLVLLAFLLGQRPRCLVSDPGVGAVSQRHDFTHGTAEIAALIGFGDRRGGGEEGLGQFWRSIASDHHAGIALVDEAGATAGNVDHFANQVGVDLLHEILEVQVEVIDAPAELGGVVVAQVFRVQVVQVGSGLDEGAARLGHLGAVDGQVAVHVDCSRLAEAGTFEHGRPEQGVEVDDVLADEVIQLGLGAFVPESVEVQLRAACAQVLEAGHVADWRVQPDVEILARLARDLEAEVRRITRDVPLLQAGIQPFGKLVGHGVLQGSAAGPLLQHGLEVRQLEEEVLGIAQHRSGPGDGRLGVLQLSRGIGGAAFLAVVAVLILSRAFRAGALDETVGQEHALFGVEILGH